MDSLSDLSMLRYERLQQAVLSGVRMLVPGYEARKAAQAVAFFALKAGGSINVLRLSKLIYLAEREYISRYDDSMFYDYLCSMPDGPVASITLNLINGNAESGDWSEFVAPRDGYDIKVSSPDVTANSLDDLSEADLEVLHEVWGKFKKYSKYGLRDYTHKAENVPEWRDPQGSSLPISYEEVFSHLGRCDAENLAKRLERFRSDIDKLRDGY